MRRFGFRVTGGFRFSSNNTFGTQPNGLTLERRDASGGIQATYTTTLPADWNGEWINWTMPATTLNANQLYIFTSWLNTAFTQRVDSGSRGDAAAGYPGGSGYNADVASGGLTSWSVWGVHSWDFQFRVQTRNATCQ